MLPKGFVVAMCADVALAKYDQPTAIVRRARRWMIVSRWGSNGRYLTISDAGPVAAGNLVATAEQPPIGLAPIATALGVLFSEDPQAGSAVFLLVRHHASDLRIAGTFFPADGYGVVAGQLSALQLRMQGRHAHSRGRCDGRSVRKDIAGPPDNPKLSMAWHVEAARRSWIGEFSAPEPAVIHPAATTTAP